jgi:hypothetical protein
MQDAPNSKRVPILGPAFFAASGICLPSAAGGILLALLFTFDATATGNTGNTSTAFITATESVAQWFVESEWIELGGSYKGAEGTQWIVENDEPTLIYAAHHDFLVFKWSRRRGFTKWRDDSPEATSFRPDGKGGYYVVEQTTRRVTR